MKKCNFNEFWSEMAQKSISEESLKTDYGVNYQPFFAQNVSKEK